MRLSVRTVFNLTVLVVVVVLTALASVRTIKERLYPPQVLVQVLVSSKAIKVDPDHARVGQRIRFLMDASDEARHLVVLDGTPVEAEVFYRYITRKVDWTPTKPGPYVFRDRYPDQHETATFTVEPG